MGKNWHNGNGSNGHNLPAKRGRGMPTKLTPIVQGKILKAIEVGAPYELACLFAGVDRGSLYNWRMRGEEEEQRREKEGDQQLSAERKKERATEELYLAFTEKLRLAEGAGVQGCLATIKDASKKEWQAAAWLLERRYPRQFGRSEHRIIAGDADGGPVKHLHVHASLPQMLQDPKAMEAYVLLEGQIRRPPADAEDSGESNGEPGGSR